MDAIKDFLSTTGFAMFADNWGQLVMLLVSFVLLYLAIVKKFEPLLLLPIAFGMLLTNLPGAGMYHPELFADGYVHWADFAGHGEGAVTPVCSTISISVLSLTFIPALSSSVLAQ